MVNRLGMMPSVGVIVPNHSRTCPMVEAVESVLGQSYSGLVQVYVVYRPRNEFDSLNDHFDDSVRLVPSVDEVGRNSISVKRNLGLSASQEDLVAFLDDDDIWHPDKLVMQVSAFRMGREVVAVGTRPTYFTRHPEWRVGGGDAESRDRTSSQVVSGKYFGTSSLLVDGEVARQLRFDERPEWLALEDYDFKIRLSQVGTMRELNGRYTAYRANDSSVSLDERRHTLLRAVSVLAASAERDRPNLSQKMVALRLLVVSAFGGFGDVQEFHGSEDDEAEQFLSRTLDSRLFGRFDPQVFRLVRTGWRRGWKGWPVRPTVKAVRGMATVLVRLLRRLSARLR